MDRYAADLAALLDYLDVKDAILVGHSTGGGEVAHHIGTYGTKRVAKAVPIGAVPPLMNSGLGEEARMRRVSCHCSVHGPRPSPG